MAKSEDELRAEAEKLISQTSPTVQGMVALNEVYNSLQAGGFTRLEALWIVGYVVSGAANLGEGS